MRYVESGNTASLYKLLRGKPIHFDQYQKSSYQPSNAGFFVDT